MAKFPMWAFPLERGIGLSELQAALEQAIANLPEPYTASQVFIMVNAVGNLSVCIDSPDVPGQWLDLGYIDLMEGEFHLF
jgi:hypothetical protein